MRYSICAQRTNKPDIATGHISAASALESVQSYRTAGAQHIQIFDIRTGRLIDEAALARADILDRQTASRTAPVR